MKCDVILSKQKACPPLLTKCRPVFYVANFFFTRASYQYPTKSDPPIQLKQKFKLPTSATKINSLQFSGKFVLFNLNISQLHTTLTPLSPHSHPTLAPLSPHSHPTIAPLSPHSRPTLAPLSPHSRPTLTPFSPHYRPTLTPLSPYSRPTLPSLSPHPRPTCIWTINPLCETIDQKKQV